MIAILLALGLLNPPAGNVTGPLLAASDQVTAVQKVPVVAAAGNAIPVGAPVWGRPFDPADRSPYAWDFSPVLAAGSLIAAIERITISAAGAAAGVQIDQQAPRLPVIAADGTHVQVWFLIDPASQTADVFTAAGIQVAVSALIRTTDTPFQEYERTLVLTVRRL
ncbi:hypothetical protein [Sphingomonas bacterium]|uniref:hypothetical protein n=1 Tax=Sphingomonas bacterium TaxID=1895847 RepID=UPI001576AA34|nr:hypothetical protein [Sphingomonas bacterium]